MFTVMEMSTGKIIRDDFGSFEDEVLNAGWVPAQPEVQLGLQEALPSGERAAGAGFDADAYLNSVYASQE